MLKKIYRPYPVQITAFILLILTISTTSLAQTGANDDLDSKSFVSEDTNSSNAPEDTNSSQGSEDTNSSNAPEDTNSSNAPEDTNSSQGSEERQPIIPKYEKPDISQGSGITFWNLLRWIISLAAVIGLIYVVMYLLRKGWIQNRRPAGTQGTFNILGHMSIGPKRMLYLVEVANRVLVLGVTEAGINTLSEITDRETVLALKNEALMYETDSRFVQYLKRAASKAKKPGRSEAMSS